MKFKITTTILCLFLCSFLSFAQKSATIKVTHFPGNTTVKGESKFIAPDYIKLSTTNLNCFKFLEVNVYVKASKYEPAPYKFKLEVKNNSSLPVSVSTSLWGLGTGGRNTLDPGESYSSTKNYSEEYKTFKIYDVRFMFDEAAKQRYGVSYESEHLDCSESLNSYLQKVKAKKEKEEKIKNLKKQINNLGSDESDLTQKLTLYKQLKEIDKTGSYNNQINSIEEKLQKISDERNKKTKDINDLKSQINNLGNSKKDLQEKKNLYKKLNNIDEENNYTNEIQEIEKNIDTIEEEEKEKEEEKEETSKEENEDDEAVTEKEKAEEEAKQKKLEEEQKLKEKKEAEERERKRKEEERKKIQAKKKAYNDRIENQRRENNAIASSAAASSAGILYMLGGIIYDRMGLPAKDLYTGSNFHVNFDLGYGISLFPIAHNSLKTTTDSNGDIVTRAPNNDPTTALTIDLRLALKIGYEMEYAGGNIFGRFEPGFSPIFTDFNTSYGYGAEIFGGHKNIKLYGRYESGSRNFSSNNWIDPEEIGEGAKSNTTYQQIRAGLKFSYYRNTRTAKRDHLIFGVMEDYFDENSASVFSFREAPSKPLLNLLSTPSERDLNPYISTGYFFEWKRDHTHRLYVEIHPNYPVTGEVGDRSNEGKLFLQIGFSRSIEGFFGKK